MRIPASVQFGGVLEKALRGPVTPVDPEEILAAVVEKTISPESASERAKKAWQKRERAKPETPSAPMTRAHLTELSNRLDLGDEQAEDADAARTAGESDLGDALRTDRLEGTYVVDERQYASAIENFREASEKVEDAAKAYRQLGEALPEQFRTDATKQALERLNAVTMKLPQVRDLLKPGPARLDSSPGGNPNWEDVQNAGEKIEAAVETLHEARTALDDALGNYSQAVHERTEPGTEPTKR